MKKFGKRIAQIVTTAAVALSMLLLAKTDVMAGEYKQLKNTDNPGFNITFTFTKSLLNSTGYFVDTGKPVASSTRNLKKGESATVKYANGYKYYDGSIYDIYVKVTANQDMTSGDKWSSEVHTDNSYIILCPFSSKTRDFDYEVWLQDGDQVVSDRLSLVGGSCYTATFEGARPWSDDGNIYTNIYTGTPPNETVKLIYSNEKSWAPSTSNPDFNKPDYYILGHGSINGVIKGGYTSTNSGNAEIVLGYLSKKLTVVVDGHDPVVLDVSDGYPIGEKGAEQLNGMGDIEYWKSDKEVTLSDESKIPAGDEIPRDRLKDIVPSDSMTLTAKLCEAHFWKFTSGTGADANKIFAECVDGTGTKGCGKSSYVDIASIITEPSVSTTLGNATEWASVVGASTTLKYVGRGETTYEESETPPTATGTYTAKLYATDDFGDTAVAVYDFAIVRIPLRIKAKDQSILYGESISLARDQIEVEGLEGGDTISLGDYTLTPSTDAVTPPEAPGTITPSAATVKDATGGNRNYHYDITYIPGKLIITKPVPTITTPPTAGPITYGDPISESVITPGAMSVPGVTDLPGTYTWKTPTEILQVTPGTTTPGILIFTPTDTEHYGPIEIEVGVPVNPKEVTITWTDKVFTYDGEEHIPTATVGGLVGSDTCTVTKIDTPKKDSCDKGNNGNPYTAEAKELNNPNYKLPTDPEPKCEFRILPKPLVSRDIIVEVDPNSPEDDPQFILRCGETVLEPGVDYDADDRRSDDDAILDIVLKGNYKGEFSKKVELPKGQGKVQMLLEVNDDIDRELHPVMNDISKEKTARRILTEHVTDPEVKEKIAQSEDTNLDYYARVSMVMSALPTESVPPQDEEAIAAKREELTAKDAEIATYFDLSLYLTFSIKDISTGAVIQDGTTQLHETQEEETVTITVPSALQNTSIYNKRTFYLLRAHDIVHPDGNVSVSVERVAEPTTSNTISFKTRLYSTYVLLYKDEAITPPTPPKGDPEPPHYGGTPVGANNAITPVSFMYLPPASPKTSDTNDGYVYALIVLAGLFLLGLAACAKKNKQ